MGVKRVGVGGVGLGHGGTNLLQNSASFITRLFAPQRSLRYAPLRSAPRRSATHQCASFRCAPLCSAVLRYAPLRRAPLRSPSLRSAPLRITSLCSAQNHSASLRIILQRSIPFRFDSLNFDHSDRSLDHSLTRSLARGNVSPYERFIFSWIFLCS